MSKVFVSDINLSNIADAIRAKNGAQTQYYPREMAAAIIALDAEQHKPIQVNIQQSANQTIKVKVKQKELNSTTINTNVEPPETIQLEATVTADEGYTPGTLNQSLVNAEWGDTVTFSASQATVNQQPNISMTLNEDMDTSGTISYNILVENTGNVDLTEVEIACEETGDQLTISFLPIYDNYTLDLADSASNTIVVTATSGSYSTSQTFYVAIPVDVTITTLGATKEYDGTSLTSSDYSVNWPRDTTDTITVTVTGSQREVGSSNNTFTYEIEYNDNPRKYNYNIIPNYGYLTVTGAPTPDVPTPDVPTPSGPSGPTP